MKHPRCFGVLGLLMFTLLPSLAHAQNTSALYRLTDEVGGFLETSDKNRGVTFVAGIGTEFRIVSIADKSYLIQVTKAVDITDAELDVWKQKYKNASNTNTIQKIGPSAKLDARFNVDRSDLINTSFDFVNGPTAGALTVPFRLSISDGKILPGGTIGAYGGYTFLIAGVETTILGAVSLGNVPLGSLGSTDVTTIPGISAAVGLLLNLFQNFQLGFVVGIDHTGNSSFSYEHKPWVSFGVGYDIWAGSTKQ